MIKMSLFRRLMLILGAGGAGYQSEHREEANILGVGHVCSIASEKLIATITSLATLSISEIRLTVSPPAAGTSLCTLAHEVLTSSIASVYSLATAET